MAGAKYDRLIRLVNPPEHDHFTRNKLESYRILTANGIRTPEVYGLVEGASGATWDGNLLRSIDDLESPGKSGDRHRMFQVRSGTQGRGFYKVKINNGTSEPIVTIEPRGEELPLRDFWATLREARIFGGYLCQAVIDQHPDVARFNPWSVNTARTWMVRTKAGEWRMHCANLRMGLGRRRSTTSPRVDRPRDRHHTGRLSSAIQRRVDRPVHVVHPVTGEQIEGVSSPNVAGGKCTLPSAQRSFSPTTVSSPST